MRDLIPHRLWIGNARDARDIPLVCSLGITAVIDLAIEEPPIALPRELTYCRVPLLDGAGNTSAAIQTAIAIVTEFIKTKVPTLVGCSGGMSRSPANVAAALARVEDASLQTMLERVVRGAPCDVAPALWRDIYQLHTVSNVDESLPAG